MSSWIKSDVRFPHRGIILFVRASELRDRSIPDALSLQDVALIESMARVLITDARPELENCSIHSMHFSHYEWAWEFVVEHPSLPTVDDGAMLKREPLYAEQLATA